VGNDVVGDPDGAADGNTVGATVGIPDVGTLEGWLVEGA